MGRDIRGLLTSIFISGVEDLFYSFDTKGNLSYRTDNLTNQKEQFTFDEMKRVTNWDLYHNCILAIQNRQTYYNLFCLSTGIKKHHFNLLSYNQK